MTTELRDPRHDLRGALDAVTAVVDRVIAALGVNGSDDGTVLDVEGREVQVVDSLGAALAHAAGLVAARAGHATWRARFGADSWAERDRVLRERLEADVDDGTAAWLDAWIAALTSGAWEEVWRLLGASYPLADWGTWLPDRAAAVQQAVETAPHDPARAVQQLTDLVEVLLEGLDERSSHVLYVAFDELADDAAAGRINLILVLSRVLALDADTRAVSLLARARRLLGTVRPGAEASLGRSIIAAESFAERHGLQLGRAGSTPGEFLRFDAAADVAGIHEVITRTRAQSPGDVAPEEAEASKRQLWVQTQSMVDSLKDVSGCVPGLRMLVEPPADELLLALAARLLREEQYEEAQEIAERLWLTGLDTLLQLPAAELRVGIAEGLGDGPDQVADALMVAGDHALWAGETDLAVARVERSLALRPDHPEALRYLADALQVGAPTKEAEAARRDLNRALDLCDRAEAIDPVDATTSWSLVLVRTIHAQLAVRDPETRGRHYWQAAAATAKALRAGPTEVQRWSLLIDDLTPLGLAHTAYVAALHYRTIAGDTAESTRQLVIAALNTGRADEALSLLEGLPSEPDEDPGWLDGLRGYAHGLLDHHAEAEEFLGRARAASSHLVYREWSAKNLTRSGRPEAEPLWQSLWKDVRLEDPDELSTAVWAALYQQLLTSARQLAERLAPAERMVAGIRTADAALAVAELVASKGSAGWESLDHALARTLLPHEVQRSGRLVQAVLLRYETAAGQRSVERLEQMVARRLATLSHVGPDGDPVAAMRAELDWVQDLLGDEEVDGVVDELRRTMQLVAEQEDAPPHPSGPTDARAYVDQRVQPAWPESDEDVIAVVMPPTWFAGLEGRESDHEFFVRGLPYARAALRRREPDSPVMARAVRVRAEPWCEPDLVHVEVAGHARHISGVEPASWYCPASWLASLRRDRAETAVLGPLPDLYTVVEPADPTDRLSSWSFAETVARLVLDAAEVHERRSP